MNGDRTLRLGAGAGFSGDRIDPAVDLARRGELDFLILECLAERTIAAAQLRRRRDPRTGYDPLLERRVRALLPSICRNGTRVITNMGAANPSRAGEVIVALAEELGCSVHVAVVSGDDILELLDLSTPALESGRPLRDYGEIVSANAYLGIDAILPALRSGAQIVVTGRVADASLFLAPLVDRFGWESNDHDRLAAGIVVGHLLECAGQLCGGYFADPGKKDIPDMARLGFPFATVDSSGSATFTKLSDTGGAVTRATVIEQLLYEVGDPTAYLTPDVTVDFRQIDVVDRGHDRVLVSGAKGSPRPAQLKVSVGYVAGYVGEGEISYAATNAVARARLAADIIRQRLAPEIDTLRVDIIGSTAMHENASFAERPHEVRLRVAGRAKTAAAAQRIGEEVDALYTCGPAGGGGARSYVREQVGIVSTLVDRERVTPRVSHFRTRSTSGRTA